MHIEPWYWLILGVGLCILEMLLPTFAALWFGVAAIVVAFLLWLIPAMSLTVQIILWLALSLVCVWIWFWLIQPRIKMKTNAGLGAGVIVGEVGIIIQRPYDGREGKVRFNVPKGGASEWLCRVLDGGSVEVGDRVIVTNIIGNELIVAKK